MKPEELDAIKVSQGVTVQELAEALDVPANDIIKRCSCWARRLR